MTDPEIEYRRLTSGDAGALRDRVETLRAVTRKLDGAREDVEAAARIPGWSGLAATAYSARADGLAQGTATAATVVVRARGALETAASALDTCVDQAEHYIRQWRDRPAGWPEIVEEVFARLVNTALIGVGTTYNEQLTGITAVLDGEEVDLDELDQDTRAWVEQGLEKNQDWLDGNGSSLGPLIPNTAATGDDRGLVPQGLGYDPGTNSLLQAYDSGNGSGIAVIDEATGAEAGEVTLGGGYRNADGELVPGDDQPTHAGGVSVDGDNVYVTDNGRLHTYSLSEIRSANGGTVQQTAPPETIEGGSYTTYADGLLYSGEFSKTGTGLMHVYRPDGSGGWDKVDEITTPARVQGVVVRDGEYVYSTSYGRHGPGALHVQGKDGSEQGVYPLPNMSQGVVEVDGELVTTYESGAGKFSEAGTGGWGWLWGVPDAGGLWANPYMTRTPLDELGLEEDIEMDPPALDRGAADLDPVAAALTRVTSTLEGVDVPASTLGRVPAAGRLSRSVSTLLDDCADSVRVGARAVRRTADELRATRRGFEGTDDAVARSMRR